MKDRDLKIELENAVVGLNWEEASWINKHFIVDLQDKTMVMLAALMRFEDNPKELQEIESRVVEFMDTVQPIIKQIQNKEI